MMIFNAAGLTDVGQQREFNEDSFKILPERNLFVLADGMGGHRGGHVASQMAVLEICSFFEATPGHRQTWPFSFDPELSEEENQLVTAVKFANFKIFDASTRHNELRGMGTTVVSAYYAPKGNQLYFAHVGDSRAYRIRSREITQVTRDHSLVNDYIDSMPDITESQLAEIPNNVITRALGMQDDVVVDLNIENPHVGDQYLLCSDGLNGMLSDQEILDCVLESSSNAEHAVSNLVKKANEKGGEDNVTIILLSFIGNDKA